MTAAKRDNARVSTLAQLLDELTKLHGALVQAVDERIAALRTSDFEALRAALEAEERLLERLRERDGLRRQLTENIARGYGIAPGGASKLSARQLAGRIGGANGAALIAAADRLKPVLEQLAQRNRLAQLITRNVLRHVEHLFAALTGGPNPQRDYGRGGAVSYRPGQIIFDTVG
jgi:hypothetical protein